MWGTDMTTTVTTEEGLVHVFVAVDHCTCECVGLHAAKRGDRFEALEPLRQGVREHFGGFDRGIAVGLVIRHDTLKEQVLWVRTFATVAELAEALREFKRTYNEKWLIGRHGHRAPSQVRRDLVSSKSAAA